MLTRRSASTPRRSHRLPLRLEPLEDRLVLDAGFSALVAFGDSLTDTGNVFIGSGGLIPASPPYFNGRFSNGPVWLEYLAEDLGLPAPEPALTQFTLGANGPHFVLGGGTNYAFADAETGPGFNALGVPNIGTQISFLDPADLQGDNDLVVLWAGANDFLGGGQTDPAIPVANLAQHLTDLANRGAENFLVGNLPPLGLLPDFQGQPDQATFLNLATLAFNDQLNTMLNTFESTHPDINVFRLDAFNLAVEELFNPGAFGFTTLTDPALNPDGTIDPNPETHVLWDSVHPTTTAHAVIGQAALAALPTPGETIGTVDPATLTWYLRNTNNPGAPNIAPFAYGGAHWTAVVGDWDGNGSTTIAAIDPQTMTWYLRNSNSAGAPDFTPFAYGGPGWLPVVGDWDGDGRDSIGVFDPGTGTWYLRNSNSAGAPDIQPFVYGLPGWLPVAGDWDGDGSDSIGIFDPSTATWYLRNSNSAGAPDIQPFAYGGVGWTPVAGDWDGDGVTTVGAINPARMTWFLRNSNSAGSFDIPPVTYGSPGWAPVVGNWLNVGETPEHTGEEVRFLQSLVEASLLEED
jgi:phospholipase/lecithinase/hemolysin